MSERSTYDRLLAAALAEFDATGYEATTVAKICRRANVSNGSFFHAFPSKAAVAGAVFLSALETYHAALIEAVSPCTTAADGITALVTAHIHWVMNNRLYARFMFVHAPSATGDDIRSKQEALNMSLRAGLAAWYEPLMQEGTLRTLPPEVLVCQIIGPAQMFCRAWLSGRKRAKPDAHLPQLITCAIGAVVAGGQDHERRRH